ncbi:hypothetical protein ABIC08_006878 [Bradyrhizobium sp. RT9b]|uniref:hypothetical protein n=1 Tax=Bradyrhizobium sp. RT9b TaxID=3156385 RepID=UPI0033926F73
MATLKEEYEQRKNTHREAPDSLTNRERTIRLFERLIPMLVPVAGGLWAVILFTNSQSELAAKAAVEQAAQSRARLVEAQKPFIEYQFAVYKDLTKLLGEMLFYYEQPGEREKWFRNYDSYWRLTSGTMHFVESDTVRDAVNDFNVVLEKYRADGGMENYQNARKAGETLIVTMKNDQKSSWTTGELGVRR